MADRPADSPSDWRRQRRRGRGPHAEPTDAAEETPGAETDDGELELPASRTLFSFLEPTLNAIGAYGAPVVFAGVVALVVGIIVLAFVNSLQIYGLITLGFGLVLLLTIGLIYLSTVFAAFVSRTGRYGVNSLIMLAAFLGIIVVINFIAFGNNSRIDTTATQQFSLATSTRNLLNDLEQPVRATAFYLDNAPVQDPQQIVRRVKVEDTLSEFSARSGRFTYEFVDPDIEPDVARERGFAGIESIVVEGRESGSVHIVQPTDPTYTELEQDLYTSILVATGREQKKVYFLAGHGERNINGVGGDGYASIRDGLERDNYRVETLRWGPADDDVSVPEDAALLVIAGPSGELPAAHQTALDNYLLGDTDSAAGNSEETGVGERSEGARLIFLAEPDTDQSFREFLVAWGVVIDKGYILDSERSVPGTPQTLRLTSYSFRHPLAQQIVVPRGAPLNVSFMPGTTSVRVVEDGLRVAVPLAGTSANSFLIDDLERVEPITGGGEGSDPTGVFSPAMYIQAVAPIGAPAPTTQPDDIEISSMVVFGDSDFVANSFVDRGSGAALFLNSANFLLGDFSLVSIRDRQFVFREFNLDKNQHNFVRFSSWFFLPGIMGLMAGLVWWLRR